MARILWHGIPPWHTTGYGVQTRIFVPRLASLGHEIVIAQMGRAGRDDSPGHCHKGAVEHIKAGHWQGHKIIGPSRRHPLHKWRPGEKPIDCYNCEFGMPDPADIADAFGGHDPDLVIVLKDPWVLTPQDYEPYNTAVWVNIDCKPLSIPDYLFFDQAQVRPIAVSKFGLSMLRDAGFKDSMYIPHGIDMAEWEPMAQEDARDLLSLPRDVEIWGINATNAGWRKAWGEQFSAFAEHHHRFAPGSLLLVHSAKNHPEGIALNVLADDLGLTPSSEFVGVGQGANVIFPDQLDVPTGHMRQWYYSLTGLLAASYGEGFGVPIAEALACGIPVIGTDCSAMPEKITAGAGRLVSCQPWWNQHFAAWWHIPRVKEITAAMGRLPPKVPDDVRYRYDADMILTEYWKPALDKLLAGEPRGDD